MEVAEEDSIAFKEQPTVSTEPIAPTASTALSAPSEPTAPTDATVTEECTEDMVSPHKEADKEEQIQAVTAPAAEETEQNYEFM